MGAELVSLPAGFHRYPTPGPATHGTICVDLGTWISERQPKRFVLKVHGDKLAALIEKVNNASGRQRCFAGDAIMVFAAAGKWDAEAGRVVDL